MTKKDRVIAAIEHRTPDRIPTSDSFWEDTISAWHSQGLPSDKPMHELFGFDIVNLSIDASPAFRPELLQEEMINDETYRIFKDRMGYVAKKIKGKSRTLEFLSYPAQDRDSWNEMKNRFELNSSKIARIDNVIFPFRLDSAPSWSDVKRKIEEYRRQGYYLLAGTYGPHEATWRFHGFTETLMDLALDPELISDIAGTYVNFLLDVIQRCLDEGISFDGFIMIDDIAGKNGMLFSPEKWREIYKPLVAKLGSFLRENNLHFWIHCCGNSEAVFRDFIECGLQVLNPLEVKSGLDVAELKENYGDDLTFFGNIDVMAMAKSDPIFIEKEIQRKLGAFKKGGYIYHSDHSIPPEITLERYKQISEFIKKYGS